MAADDTRQVAFRFTHELLARLDAWSIVAELRTPGLGLTRADAARVLLHVALGRAEAGYSPEERAAVEADR